MQKHKLVKTFLLYISILLGVFASWVLYDNVQDTSDTADDESKTSNATTEIPITNYETETVEQLTEKSATSAESYARLMAAGQKKFSVERYDEALSYYEAATKIEELTKEQEDYAYISVYWAAEKLQLSDKMQEAKANVDEAVFLRYTNPTPQVDQ